MHPVRSEILALNCNIKHDGLLARGDQHCVEVEQSCMKQHLLAS